MRIQFSSKEVRYSGNWKSANHKIVNLMPPTVGEEINLFFGDDHITFPANEPFYISHGWADLLGQSKKDACEDEKPCGVDIGHNKFLLEVDGVYLEPDFHWVYNYRNNPEGKHPPDWEEWIASVWVYNFPQRMTGTHEFTGHWMTTCEDAVERWGYEGECKSPAELVDVFVRTVTVEFVEP
jgi:hypothetical protein